ncbi:MAG TPA: PEP/pyruvate-binding domain-containing protein, partial [Candidatus Bathyarchaeia archaeon]
MESGEAQYSNQETKCLGEMKQQERYVTELDGREGYTVSDLGGKAFNLNRLVSMGARVPRGFAVKTGAYRAFTEQRGLRDAIKNFMEKSKSLTPDELRPETEGLRRLFLTHPVPGGILEEIMASYSRLLDDTDSTEVSVRSSATSEDLAEASFAGLHSTFLNVSGLEEVLSSIKGCWASLWSPEAVSYRERCGFDHTSVAMGVVVQLMVPADRSGVIFTSNPVNDSRSELVINAVRGLGEKLVSGQVTPDVY